MAKKIILRAILPILVFGMALFSVFWFVKSGEIKKNIKEVLELSASSQVGNISSTGFPLSHKIEIENISLIVNKKIEDTIVIEKIIAESAIFSNEFTANIIGDIVIESVDNSKSTIKFNQDPIIKFSVEDYKVNKVIYSDDGYKLLDNSGNTIFYTGSSNLLFNISSDNNGITKTSLNANFRNISSFDIFTVGDIIEVADSKEENSPIPTKDLTGVEKNNANPDAMDVDTLEVRSNIKTVDSGKIKTNRDLVVDLFILSQINKQSEKLEIKDVTINNIELFSPLFKVNVSGSVNSVSKSDQKIDFVLKIKNIDNILIYIRKFISSLIPINLEIVDAKSVENDQKDAEKDSQEGVDQEKKDQESVEEVQIIQPIPEEIIAGLIIELAQRNVNSNDQFSEFRIVGSETGFAINDMAISEIFKKLEPIMDFLIGAFFGNESAATTPIPKGQVEEENLELEKEENESNIPADIKDNAPIAEDIEVMQEPEAVKKPNETKAQEVKDQKSSEEVTTPVKPKVVMPKVPEIPTPEVKPDVNGVDVVPEISTQEEEAPIKEEAPTIPTAIEEIDPTKVDPAILNTNSKKKSNQ